MTGGWGLYMEGAGLWCEGNGIVGRRVTSGRWLGGSNEGGTRGGQQCPAMPSSGMTDKFSHQKWTFRLKN